MAEVIETDVLVVGGGGAADRAAIEAYEAGARTTLAVKGRFGWRGLRGLGATGYNVNFYIYFPAPQSKVATRDEESEMVYKRIIQAGQGIADRKLVRALVEDAREAKEKLHEWGVVLPEAALTGLTTAVDLYRSERGISVAIDPNPGVANIIRGTTKINILEQTMVTDLLVQDGVCVGAVGLNEETGETVVLKSKATILATGGKGQLFKFNRHPSCVTGDGYAMGYNAGAELMNLEFIYTDVGTAFPNCHNIISSVWKAHPKLLNGQGKEFLSKYLPEGITLDKCMADRSVHNAFSARDMGRYVDIAIAEETRAGRVNEHGACYLEAAPLRNVLNQDGRDWRTYIGIDMNSEYVEVTNMYHCSHGGLRVDENGQTTVPGLYAVGEVAGGIHGADRLGGAMIAACQVFGRRAGRHAAAASKKQGKSAVQEKVVKNTLSRIAEVKKRKGDRKPVEVINVLKDLAWKNLLAVRNGKRLTSALQQIEEMQGDMSNISVESPFELVQALELENMLKCGEMVARAALMRTESRGAHYRQDFPERDDAGWLKVITLKKDNEKMRLGKLVLDKEWKFNRDEMGEKRWA